MEPGTRFPGPPAGALTLPLAVSIVLSLGAGLACADGKGPAGASPRAKATSAADATPAADAAGSAKPGGFVVWESNRSGEFRIWRQNLAGGTPLRISANEPGRDHCCASLSPTGSRLVYLSLPGGARRYSRETGQLHLVDSDGGRDRVLIPAARHYGEHRAVVWWGEDELVYIDGQNATQRLELSTGATRELLSAAQAAAASPLGEGFLVAPGGRIATANTPTFSDCIAGSGIRLRPSIGGCQPAFSNDGSLAVWSAGAGGPIDVFDLATRQSWTVLEKGDPHFPPDRGYLYFPRLSNDATLLAVGASTGEHDHFRADYDIYVVELDPATLQPAGQAIPVAPDPAVDRFPDVYRPARANLGGLASRRSADKPPDAAGATAPLPLMEAERRGLAFHWQRSDAENRISSRSSSERLDPSGLAWIDRQRALALGGGTFAAAEASAQRLVEALVAKHQFTLSLLLTPASLHEDGAIVAFSDGPRARNLVLRQDGADVAFVLRTSDSPREGLSLPVARLTSTAPTHLLLTFSPGRLGIYVDGKRLSGATDPVPLPGDLFPWRPRALVFGGEAKSEQRWHGTLSEIAIWNRPLTAAEAGAEARRIRDRSNAEPPVARTVVDARLVDSSPPPSRDEISPYREALAVDEYEIERAISGPPAGSARIRVARWAILDDQTIAPPRRGETVRLVLEPFADQSQLESYFVADRLPPAAGRPLYFDLGATAAR